jgi:signal transduction histidine kinase
LNVPPPSAASPSPRRLSFRAFLIGLVLVGLVPMSIFAAALILTVGKLEQDQVRRGQFETAEAVLLAVEGEVAASLGQLEILAGSPLLDADDAGPFRHRALRVVGEGSPWTNLFLVAPDGRELMSLDRPPEPRRPGEEGRGPLDPDLVQRVVETQRPAVSRRLVGGAPGEHDRILVAVPVLSGERLLSVLAAELDLRRFDRIISERVVRTGGIASVLDDDLRMLARSRSPDEYRGVHVIARMREAVPTADRGWRRTPVYDSPDVYAVWATGPLTGWTVTMGVPAGPIDAALRRSLLLMAGVGLLILVAVGALATVQSRRLTGSIRDVAAATRALARREPLPPIRRTVREHDMVVGALEAAAGVLQEQARENELLLARETEARREAEDANRAKDEFLSMLAHELRNPLAAIGSAGAVLEANPDDAPAAARARAVVVRQTLHLARLVDDLLDAARFNSGKVRLEPTHVDLAALLERCVHTVWPDPPAHEVELDTEPVWVEGDVTRLEQVFGNLLANARKFTPQGGRVTVTLRCRGEEAVATVADTGEGMPPELVPRIFDLFVQGDRRLDRSAGGLGIGLSLARRLVELHGGTISAASAGPDRGSTFEVRLPAAEAIDEELADRMRRGSQQARERQGRFVE